MTGARTRSAVTAALAAFAFGSTAAAGATAPTSSKLTPFGLATDSQGNVYIADAENAVVKKVDPAGTDISVVAGIPGEEGLPTPGPATASRLSVPSALAVDSADNLYIADAGLNHVVEKVTPSGDLSIVAGVPGEFKNAVQPGPATSSQLLGPSGLVADADGNLFISDLWHAVVEKVDAAGALSIAAGISGIFGAPVAGPATGSYLYMPMGLAKDGNGNLYIADAGNHVVEKVDSSGTLSVVAGRVGTFGAPSPGPATFSTLSSPTGLALDGKGQLYIADAVSDVVARVDLLSGELSIVAGNGQRGAPTPGPATSSKLDGPADLAVDAAGNLFIADSVNSLVLKVDPAGTLSIFAGTGEGLDLEADVQDTQCAGGRLRGRYGNVTVPAGARCTLDGADLTGDLVADGAASAIVMGATIDGDLLIKGTEGLSVTDSTIGGDATIEDNDGPATFQNNTVKGRLRFIDNTGSPDSVLVLGNSVERSLTCSGNEGLPLDCNTGGTNGTDPEETPPGTEPTEQSTRPRPTKQQSTTPRLTMPELSLPQLTAPQLDTPQLTVRPGACSGSRVELVGVSRQGQKVRLSGLAHDTLVGRTATLSTNSGRTVGTARIGADGTFAALVAAPPAREARGVKYRATVDGVSSTPVRLQRRFVIDSVEDGRLVARVVGNVPRGTVVEITRRLNCGKPAVYERLTVGRNGRISVRLAEPPDGSAFAVFQARTVPRPGTHGRTFSLPVLVRAG